MLCALQVWLKQQKKASGRSVQSGRRVSEARPLHRPSQQRDPTCCTAHSEISTLQSERNKSRGNKHVFRLPTWNVSGWHQEHHGQTCLLWLTRSRPPRGRLTLLKEIVWDENQSPPDQLPREEAMGLIPTGSLIQMMIYRLRETHQASVYLHCLHYVLSTFI